MHIPLDEFGAISKADRFHLFHAFALSHICIICSSARAAQDFANGLNFITSRHLFSTAAWREMLLCVLEGIVAEFAAKERITLLNESTMGLLCTRDRFVVRQLHLADHIFEVFTH